MLKKIILLALVVNSLVSCSSHSGAEPETAPAPDLSAVMTTKIDGVQYDTPPASGGNLADATGGIYGNSYFLINGYKTFASGKQKIGEKTYSIKIAIPKNDLIVGTHYFNSTIAVGEYYADLDITGVTPAESVNTTNGSVTVTSYDTATKLMKGTFSFITNNGVNLNVTSHTLTGTFSFVLQ
ncbi:hypothetical protein OX284_001100 [Flavobacterium sp. SUN046]|uniref:hypothetical protein n=1 Tax=Flavobacterium sp. SUN046 TaxID=3002440 RepID=UPI002DB9F11E|nr:hypothetical protein [Flavobacterium sp. SUN046]MEC4048010.1 hypothetical protein [Flavobacterium sp. SUN046]